MQNSFASNNDVVQELQSSGKDFPCMSSFEEHRPDSSNSAFRSSGGKRLADGVVLFWGKPQRFHPFVGANAGTNNESRLPEGSAPSGRPTTSPCISSSSRPVRRGGSRLTGSAAYPQTSSRPQTTGVAVGRCGTAVGGERQHLTSGQPGTSQGTLRRSSNGLASLPSPPSTAQSASRPRPNTSSSSTSRADRDLDPNRPLTATGSKVVQYLLSKEQQLEAFDDPKPRPSAVATAFVLDTVLGLARLQSPQKDSLRTLLPFLETSVYKSGEKTWEEDEKIISEALLPKRYANRIPCYSVVKQQQVRDAELQQRIIYLDGIQQRWAKLKGFSSGIKFFSMLTGANGNSGGTVLMGPGSLAREAFTRAIRLFVWAFWKDFVNQQRRSNAAKASMIHDGLVKELVAPFKHWQMAWLDGLVGDQQQTHEAFTLEQQMLSVEVRDLENQQDDLRGELATSSGTHRRLQAKLDNLIQSRKALHDRLTGAQPQLLKETLARVLNLTFSTTLRQALLCRFVAHQTLASKDFAALLSTEEEDVMRLARASQEQLLIRWLNYHIGQMKLIANKILEILARHANNDDGGPEHGDGAILGGEVSARDIEMYAERCRLIRGIHKIGNLHEDLKDCSVLTVLYATLAAVSVTTTSHAAEQGGETSGNPRDLEAQVGAYGVAAMAALWPLDKKDPETRAQFVCNGLRLVAPSTATRCLLRPSDLTSGNSPVLPTILSSLFLSSSRLPSSVPESQVLDFASVNTVPQDMQASPWQQIVQSMEQVSSLAAYESINDLTQLLEGGEVPNDLITLPGTELMLRWLNLKLEYTGPEKVRSLKALKGGELMMELFRKVAPDVVRLIPEAKLLADSTGTNRLRLLIDVCVQCSNRCCDFDVLTKEGLFEGHVDVVTSALIGLFLARPSLPVADNSPLKEHLDVIKACAGAGQKARNEGMGIVGLCEWMTEVRDQFNDALNAVRTARRLQDRVRAALQTFQMELLVQRCNGNPLLKVSGAETHKGEAQSGDRVVALDRLIEMVGVERNKEIPPEQRAEEVKKLAQKVEDLLRKNLAFLREVFKHYSTSATRSAATPLVCQRSGSLSQGRRSTMGGLLARGEVGVVEKKSTTTLDLRGLTRLHKDCKFKKLRLSAADIESIYTEVRVEQMAGHEIHDDDTEGLTLESFVLTLVAIAARANLPPIRGRRHPDVSERFAQLMEKFIWPSAMPRNTEFFYTILYDPEMNAILTKYERLLRAVFHNYSSMALAAIAALRHRQKRSSPAPDSRRGSTAKADLTLDVISLEAMMEHASIFVEPLDLPTFRGICKNVLEGPHHSADSESSKSSTSESASDISEDSESEEDDEEDDEEEGTADGSPTQAGSSAQGSPQSKQQHPGKQGAAAAGVGAAIRRTSEGGDSEAGGGRSAFPFSNRSGQESRLAYQEFLDILIGVLMYRDPNPFQTVTYRFENFLIFNLISPLREYWQSHSEDTSGNLARSLDVGLDEALKSFKPREQKARDLK